MIKLKNNLILASKSKTRAKLLCATGLSFVQKKPEVSEQQLKDKYLINNYSINNLSSYLSKEKAISISQENLSDIVIGADTVAELEGELIEKSKSFSQAKKILKKLSGKKHLLNTSVSVALKGKVLWTYNQKSFLEMHILEDNFIDHYLLLAGKDILNSVGSYQILGVGINLFKKIDGDYFSILGLPLIQLLNYLKHKHSL